MTQEEIIELVMQIGGCDRPEENSPALKMFVTFAKLVAEKEREACAECGVNGNHALYCVACAEKYLENKNTKGQK